jgi:hypothetical protein
VAVGVALLFRGTGHHTTTSTDADGGTLPTHSSKLPPVTVPTVTTSPGPLPPTSEASTTPTTAVATCPTGSINVSLSLTAVAGAPGTWYLTLHGTATNTASGAVLLQSVVADVKNSSGATLDTITAHIDDPRLDPHYSTSLGGMATTEGPTAPKVSFGSARAVWTGPGTSRCPVPD